MGSAYLCAKVGVSLEQNHLQHAGYLQSWLKVLNDDERYFFKASKKAMDAVDFLIGQQQRHDEHQQAG